MEEPVTIVDRDVLKVLSADTRMDIMKMLEEGARTPSFMGKHLNKSDATIIEHLNVMTKAGLVKRIEQPGKKWIFYTLTERGKGIVSSKSRRLIIILSMSLLSLAAGVFSLGSYFSPQLGTFSKEMRQAASVPGVLTDNGIIAVPTVSNYLFYFGIVLIAISVVGMVFYFYKKSNSRSKPMYF